MRSKLMILALALPMLVAQSAFAERDPLRDVPKKAADYAETLAQSPDGGYAGAERRSLESAVDLLSEGTRCGIAADISKLLVSGLAQPKFDDWLRLAESAACAKRWQDAVSAAFLAAGSAPQDAERQRAFVVLGQALEAHWRYGIGPALEAYRRAAGLGEFPGLDERIEELGARWAEMQALRVERIYADSESGSPQLCIDFTEEMPTPDAQRYGDYVRFEPPLKAGFRRAAEDEICVQGPEFGARYQVVVLAGLQAESGNTMTEPFRQEVAVGDRAPALWFENRLYVLPSGGGGVPIHAVNLTRAELKLYRVGERNLPQDFLRRNFLTDLGKDEARRIRDRFGELVWKGKADLTARSNQEVVTSLPVAPLVAPAPGVYVLTAEPPRKEGDEEERWERATQWLVVSDIGLTTYRGVGGMTVVARSLRTALPLENVRIAIYARNNPLLQEVASDASGVARFSAANLAGSGGQTPDTLMAFGDRGDFNFLDLRRAAFDLSDRGVTGRPVPGPLDAFLYTERGVYRPGETARLTVLLRDDRGAAVDGLPLTLRLLRPDEQKAQEWVIHSSGAGGYLTDLPISSSARLGRWKLLAYVDPQARPIGQTAFLVEAILPPRIEVKVSERPAAALKPDKEAAFGIEARYLFGAPGRGLSAAAEVRVAADPDPVPGFPGYRFGPVDEKDDSVLMPLDPLTTDADGRARFHFGLDRLPKLRRPLRAEIYAEVRDVDGRAVATSFNLPIRTEPLLIGIKPAGEGGPVEEGSEAVFEVIALGEGDRPIDRKGLAYRLVEEQVSYQWYREGGQWRHKRQVRDRLLEEGPLEVIGSAPARISARLGFGQYRIQVEDPETGVQSSARLHVGWQAAGPESDTPDKLDLSTDQGSYAPGQLARLHVESPFAGRAELVIASDRVLEVREIELVEKAVTVEVAVDPSWGAGAYALVTAYRPDGGAVGHGPRRAIGVVWLGLRIDERRLDIALEAPEKIQPRQTASVEIEVRGQKPGTPAFLTLAAVDEGVLQLTDYRTPDPLGHYFGQRWLGVGVRDLYGALIDGRKGLPGRIRAGGGAAGRKGSPQVDVRIVSLFSGLVALDDAGRATVPLELPDFNGRLRLMAVAWNASRVGSTEGQMTVRDPVVVMPSLPRFLAAGDRSQASILIDNVEGPPGDYRANWVATGALALGDGPREAQLTLDLQQRRALIVPVEAAKIGKGRFQLTLAGPDGKVLTRAIDLDVRAPFLPEVRRSYGRLGAGQGVNIPGDLAQGLRPENLSGTVSLSTDPSLDVPGLLRQLDLYPYGCLEQVTSRAFPLLYFDRLAERWGYESSEPVSDRLADAVRLILEKQLDNGGFALWGPRGKEDPWVSAYALDFLQRAREAGVVVPDFAWRQGLDWLRRQVAIPDPEDAERISSQVYALYILARAGEAPAETARYLLEEGRAAWPGALAAAQLGAALTLMGDSARAERAFRLQDAKGRQSHIRDYGSRLRDLAARVLLRAETGAAGASLADEVQAVAEDLSRRRWLSTQEQAWLVRLAAVVSGKGEPLRLQVGDTRLPARDRPLVLKQSAAALLGGGVAVRNLGEDAAWFSVAVTGSPRLAPEPLEAGFRINRAYYSRKGAELDASQVRQGEVLLVVVEGRVDTERMEHQALIVDPLPPGLEAETGSLAHARSAGDASWLRGLSTTLYEEALDDRFVAAVDLAPGEGTFRVAYLARVVTPGLYRLPPPEVEDMYKPRYRARGESGWMSVLPAR